MRQSSERQLGEAVEAARLAMLAAPDARTRFEGLVSALGQVGFDQINYGCFEPADSQSQSQPTYLSTLSDEWLDHYVASDMHLTDPHYLKIRAREMTPYLWGDTQIRALEDPQVRQTSRAIESAGQHSAIVIPLVSAFAPATPVGGMTIASAMDEEEFAGVIGPNAGQLTMLAHLFHNMSMGELRRESMGIEPLTERERDCLRYAADGLLQAAIAHRLRVARVTVEVHMRNAKRKLKVRTLPQAIARAIALGEFPPA